MCETHEPTAGDTHPCPFCEEEDHDGTMTYTIKEHRVSAVAPDGAIPGSFTYGEWVCNRDEKHNRQPNEPC